MKATGNVKIILAKVTVMQNLIGEARALHYDDKDREAFKLAQDKLQQAFELSVEIRSMYDPF